MSDSDVYLPSVSSTKNCDTSHWSSKEEMEVRFSSSKENRVNQTKISSKIDKDGFPPPAVFRPRLWTKKKTVVQPVKRKREGIYSHLFQVNLK